MILEMLYYVLKKFIYLEVILNWLASEHTKYKAEKKIRAQELWITPNK